MGQEPKHGDLAKITTEDFASFALARLVLGRGSQRDESKMSEIEQITNAYFQLVPEASGKAASERDCLW